MSHQGRASNTYGINDIDNDFSNITGGSHQTGRRGSNQQQGSYNIDKSKNSSYTDDITLNLVKQLKNNVSGKIKPCNKQRVIELEVFKIKRLKNSSDTDLKFWKEIVKHDTTKYPDSILLRSMAYGNHPGDIQPVIDAKINEYESNRDKYNREDFIENSWDELIESLKKINNKTTKQRPIDLFEAVLNVKDDAVDRADRMFFAESKRWISVGTNYTYDMAHNQVQAIRLLNYSTDDEEVLCRLVNQCPDFKSAHSFLKKQKQQFVSNTNNQERNTSEKSANQSDSGYDNNCGGSTSGYPPLTNSDTSNRPSSRSSTSTGNRGVQNTDDSRRPHEIKNLNPGFPMSINNLH